MIDAIMVSVDRKEMEHGYLKKKKIHYYNANH